MSASAETTVVGKVIIKTPGLFGRRIATKQFDIPVTITTYDDGTVTTNIIRKLAEALDTFTRSLRGGITVENRSGRPEPIISAEDLDKLMGWQTDA